MNLDDKHIRLLLAPIYKKACLDTKINMVDLANLLEYLASMFKKSNPHTVWRKLKLNKNKYRQPAYIKYLVKLKLKYHITLAKYTAEELEKNFLEKNLEEAYQLWFKEYTDALVNWNSIVYSDLCRQPFDFAIHQKEIDKYQLLNINILKSRWSDVLHEYLAFANNDLLDKEKRCSFFIYAGQIELYHDLPDYEMAMSYFEQASQLYQSSIIQRAFGEYHLKRGEYNKAREFFLSAIDLDTMDLENYLCMGDSYRDQAKYTTAELWYDDALNMNFLDAKGYSKKITLYSYSNYTESKKVEIPELIDYLEKIEFDHPDENYFYEVYRNIGYAFSISRQYEQSAKYYQKAIKNSPNLILSYIDIGYIYTYLGKYDKAEGYFIKVKDLEGDFFGTYWGLAYLYQETKQQSKAIENYLKCLELRPSQPEKIYYYLGNLHKETKNDTEAQKYYQLAFDLNPTNKIYFKELKILLENKGDKNNLLKLLKMGIAHSPDDPLLHNDLGLFYSKNNDFDKAIQCFSKSIELNPSEPIYYENSGLTYEKIPDVTNAEKMYQKAAEIEKESGKFHNRLGYFYSSKNLDNQAVSFYKEAIQREPENIVYLNNLGIAYNRLQKWKDGEITFKKVIKIHEDNLVANPELGINLIWQKNYNEAAKYLKRALKLDPENPWRYEHLGFVYQSQFNYDKAMDLYKQGLELDPNNDALHNRVGIIKYEMKNYPEALKYYEKAMAINPENPVYYDNIGLVYESLNDTEAATAAYSKSKDLKISQK
ncbi:tetratricopeptide repeat protein [Aquimarina sp. 2304DJ70-9]|uniref:tetratricopeptide repeat protein n=1 Tax=Aquimarina penaris TaxID=3231044 RepID=UPI0034628996